ncbi:MAG: M67 family metallopeptidase [Candidatus Omnitrophica bacterium]|nr:M67 family metallopeptidase [Candidatus Omnitrophota bacterium]
MRISRALYGEIIAHCQSRYPKEACGLLAGAGGAVAQVYPMTNVEDSPIGYSMDPKEQLRVERQMRAQGQQLLGIYHSHTATDAYPSSVDVRLSISPEVSYVLISLKDRTRPILKSYRIEGTIVTPEEVVQV